MSARPARLGRALLHAAFYAFPARIRRAYRDDALAYFDDRAREAGARGGAPAVLGLVARSILSTAVSGLAERARLVRPHRPDFGSIPADVRFGLRSLRRRPSFLVSASIPIALGVAGVTAVFAVVDGVLLRPLPYPEPERLVKLGRPLPNGVLASPSTANLLDIVGTIPALSSIGGAVLAQTAVLGGNEPELMTMTRVTEDFMDVFGIEPALGRGFLAEEHHAPRVAMITWDAWQGRWGGDPEILGRTIDTELAGTLEIVGVLPQGWVPPEALFGTADGGRTPALWTPLDYDWPMIEQTRAFGFTPAAARLAPGASLEAANEQLAAAAIALHEAYPEQNAERDGTPKGLVARSLHDETVGAVGERLAMMLAAVAALLAIACANVANLFLARSSERERELAMRTVLGAGRGRLVVQLLAESLTVAWVGGALGLGLAYLSVDALAGWAPDLPRAASIVVDLRVAAFAIGVAGLCGVAFGLLPALLASDREPGTALRGGHARRRGAEAIRAALVIGQTALAVTLVTGGGLLANSAVRLARVDPGYRPDGLLAFRPRFRQGDYQDTSPVPVLDALIERLEAIPGVVSASGSMFVPGDGPPVAVDVLDPSGGEHRRYLRHSVLPGFFETIGEPVLEGRTFARDDGPAAARVAVVNRAFAEALWPNATALGRTFEVEDGMAATHFSVIGVVENVRDGGPRDPPEPVFFEAFLQNPWMPSMGMVVRHEREVADLAPIIRDVVHRVDPTVVVTDLATMPERIARHTAQERYYGILLGLFAVVALGIASVGVYAMMSYAVVCRLREMGIRRVVGAGSGSIAALVARRGLAQAAAGVGIGLSVAALTSRMLTELLFGVTPMDPITYMAVAIVLGAVALAACALPARRAVRADPVEILRAD